jgi:hypothetical protein
MTPDALAATTRAADSLDDIGYKGVGLGPNRYKKDWSHHWLTNNVLHTPGTR